jgi:hypothetical protein
LCFLGGSYPEESEKGEEGVALPYHERAFELGSRCRHSYLLISFQQDHYLDLKDLLSLDLTVKYLRMTYCFLDEKKD